MILPTRWDPFKDIERFFEDIFPFGRIGVLPSLVSDVYETDKEFVIEVELPGVKKNDVKVKYHDGYVTVEAKREEAVEEKDKNYYRREIKRGSYARTFPLPENVDVSKAKAKMSDGVLEIRIPKTSQEVKGTEIKVE